jgi:formylglycine-generating enzyme required for sulfatase activity
MTVFGQVNIKETDRSLAKINDDLYASKYEVSNDQYMQFLSALKKANQNDKYKITQIDTANWIDKLAYNVPYAEYYHKHPAYKDYPVVNINHAAAMMFCEWLTNEYNSTAGRKFKKVKFRLPSEQEWMIAAQGGDATKVYPWQGIELINEKGQYRCNYSRSNKGISGIAGSVNDAADITAPVNSYYPNNFGLYNMSGNVAEMLSDKSVVKGGSWNDGAEFLTIGSKQTYDGTARKTVGFRYFVDIIEK